MTYFKARWIHDTPGIPVLLYSELGDDRYENRKIELWADGKYGLAYGDYEYGGTILGDQEVPGVEDINQDEEFEAEEISAEEFEEVWRKYTATTPIP